MMMLLWRERPYLKAGVVGIACAALIFLALSASGREAQGLWAAAAALPAGGLAAYLAARGTSFAQLKEGALAGLLVGHFAALLQVYIVVRASLTIDWTAYSAQVGAEIASGVRQVAAPLTAIAALLGIATAYIVSIALGLAGAWLVYTIQRAALGRE